MSEEELKRLLRGVDLETKKSTSVKDFDPKNVVSHEVPYGDQDYIMEVELPKWAVDMRKKADDLKVYLNENRASMVVAEYRALDRYVDALVELWWAKVRLKMPMSMKLAEMREDVKGMNYDKDRQLIRLFTKERGPSLDGFQEFLKGKGIGAMQVDGDMLRKLKNLLGNDGEL